MTSTIFRQHLLRRGLKFSLLRLGVFWGLILLDSTLHPGLSFLPMVLLFGIVFFPEGFVLDGWIHGSLSRIELSAVIVITSFLGAALWTLIIRQADPQSTISN